MVAYELVPELKAAIVLRSRGQQDAALEALDTATKKHPRNARVLVEAAREHARRFNVHRVESLLGELRRLAPRFPGVQHLVGEVYAFLAWPEKARACFERAASLPGVLPETWVALADLHERGHQLDVAMECIQKAIKLDNRFPSAQLSLARIERRVGNIQQSEILLRELISSLPEGDELANRAYGELAQLLDEQDDHQGAFQAIEKCKQIQLSRDQAEWTAAKHVSHRFNQMVAAITPADFARWHSAQSQFRPARVALLCGFPRSGTTLVEQMLDAHPEIVSSEERGFLAQEAFPTLHQGKSAHSSVQDVLDGASVASLLGQRERYLRAMEALLEQPLKNRLHLDKNPAYVPFIPIFLRLFPESRLIVTLRDPRDVVISCYLRYLPLNPLSVNFLSLERTIERYTLDMQAWLRFREMIQAEWCQVKYENVIADREREVRRILKTLQLDWNPEVLRYRQRLPRRIVSSPSYESVTKPIYTSAIGRWKNYEKQLEPFLGRLAPLIEKLGYD